MTMCRVLNVARAGFYAWLHNPVSARDKDNQRLLMLIRDSYSLSGGVYGYRRVHGDLNEIGETCGKNRVGRIMQQNRIKAVRGYKAPRRIAGRPSVVAPNRVQRQFTVVRANQVWVTDITYIRTWQGWLYLAVVIDLFARNVGRLVDEAHSLTRTGTRRADDGRLAAKTGRRGHRALRPGQPVRQ